MSNNYFEDRSQGGNTLAAQSPETLYASRERILMPHVSLVLEDTAIFTDRTKDKLFARCTFRSIADKEITAILVEISCQDDRGNTLGDPFLIQYLDLKARRGSTFGKTSPIALPDKATRQIRVYVKKVLLADGTMLTGSELAFELPEPVLLSKYLGSEELAAQYARETTARARYAPERGNYYWLCTCGEINGNGEETCCGCGCGKEQVSSALNPYQLQANMLIFAQGQARHGQEQAWGGQGQNAQEILSAANQTKPEKRRKKGRVAVIISLILVAALGCGAVFFGIPYLNYRSACKALENGEYDTAYEAFADLGDFMDSEELALEARYLQANQYQNSKKYKEAYTLFLELGSYKKSRDEVLETILLWEEEALDSSSAMAAYSISETVQLSSGHYEKFYSAIVDYLNSHENAEYWFDWGGTVASEKVEVLLRMLPSSYEDTSTLQSLFKLLAWEYTSYESLFRDNSTIIQQCWYLGFVQDLAGQDEAIYYFLESYWTTYSGDYYMDFYENSEGGTTSDHTLPWVAQPYGTQYFKIVDMIYYWSDDKGPLAEVYRFEIVDYDTIDVYCYQDNQTYTLYRN